MSVSFRDLARHIHAPPPAAFSLRQQFGLKGARLRFRVRKVPFTILTYNMALLDGMFYNGTNRGGAIQELIARIKANPPDVVGLCEVFVNSERQQIRTGLRHVYAHSHWGPDEGDLHEDGGLLLLSKHPFLSKHASIYRQCAGFDCMANKGMLHIRVQPPGSPVPYDIYYTHAQDIEPNFDLNIAPDVVPIAPDAGKKALYSQLLHVAHLYQACSNPHHPKIILGDLNIPGEVPQHYDQLIQRLAKPVDMWVVAGNASSSGFTHTRSNNFYEDSEDAPSKDSRLDYVLMKAGQSFIPILKEIEILKWSRNGRQISDHFGLLARFDQLVEVGVDISGTISAVRTRIKAFRCLDETSGGGSDQVRFRIRIMDRHGNFAVRSTSKFENVVDGDTRNVTMEFARLNGDPGNSVNIQVSGVELDNLSGDDNLGKSTISLSRTDLLLKQGSSFTRHMPLLTGDGGEYSLVIEVFAD
jgi:hypothetical protein